MTIDKSRYVILGASAAGMAAAHAIRERNAEPASTATSSATECRSTKSNGRSSITRSTTAIWSTVNGER